MSTLRQGLERLGMSYKEYLQSDHWKATKKRYYASRKKECWVCGSTVGIDLHHKTYANLGRERIHDLVPLCRNHHEQFHRENGLGDKGKKTKRFVKKLSKQFLPNGLRRIMNGKVQAVIKRTNGKGSIRKNFTSIDAAVQAQNAGFTPVRKKPAPKRPVAINTEARPLDSGKSVIASTDGPPCRNCDTPMLMMKHPETWTPPKDRGYYAFWWLCKNDKCKTTLVMPKGGYQPLNPSAGVIREERK